MWDRRVSVDERLQVRPDDVGDRARAGGVRVHQVRLHHLRIADHVPQHERHERDVELRREFANPNRRARGKRSMSTGQRDLHGWAADLARVGRVL